MFKGPLHDSLRQECFKNTNRAKWLFFTIRCIFRIEMALSLEHVKTDFPSPVKTGPNDSNIVFALTNRMFYQDVLCFSFLCECRTQPCINSSPEEFIVFRYSFPPVEILHPTPLKDLIILHKKLVHRAE